MFEFFSDTQLPPQFFWGHGEYYLESTELVLGCFIFYLAVPVCGMGPGPCIEDGKFDGKAIDGIDIKMVKKVDDEEACQKLCQDHDLCEFWTYNFEKKICWLQTDIAPTAKAACGHGNCRRGRKFC